MLSSVRPIQHYPVPRLNAMQILSGVWHFEYMCQCLRHVFVSFSKSSRLGAYIEHNGPNTYLPRCTSVIASTAIIMSCTYTYTFLMFGILLRFAAITTHIVCTGWPGRTGNYENRHDDF